jgi:hypothetical protein
VIDTTGNLIGNEIDDNGVPAGTDNDNTCPPNNVTVTAHESAEADGNTARPERPSADTAPAAATTSFRLLNTVVYLLPAVRLRNSSMPRSADCSLTGARTIRDQRGSVTGGRRHPVRPALSKPHNCRPERVPTEPR